MGEMPRCTCSHRFKDHDIRWPESPPSVAPCQVEPCNCPGYSVDTDVICEWIMERTQSDGGVLRGGSAHIDGGRA
jgi:hypothetical protein